MLRIWSGFVYFYRWKWVTCSYTDFETFSITMLTCSNVIISMSFKTWTWQVVGNRMIAILHTHQYKPVLVCFFNSSTCTIVWWVPDKADNTILWLIKMYYVFKICWLFGCIVSSTTGKKLKSCSYFIRTENIIQSWYHCCNLYGAMNWLNWHTCPKLVTLNMCIPKTCASSLSTLLTVSLSHLNEYYIVTCIQLMPIPLFLVPTYYFPI